MSRSNVDHTYNLLCGAGRAFALGIFIDDRVAVAGALSSLALSQTEAGWCLLDTGGAGSLRGADDVGGGLACGDIHVGVGGCVDVKIGFGVLLDFRSGTHLGFELEALFNRLRELRREMILTDSSCEVPSQKGGFGR